jgi:hypothetical protein
MLCSGRKCYRRGQENHQAAEKLPLPKRVNEIDSRCSVPPDCGVVIEPAPRVDIELSTKRPDNKEIQISGHVTELAISFKKSAPEQLKGNTFYINTLHIRSKRMHFIDQTSQVLRHIGRIYTALPLGLLNRYLPPDMVRD